MTPQRPPRELIERLLAAAVEAPNHHETEPWRFFVLAGKARGEFGEVLVQALKQRLAGEDERKVEGLALAERAKPLRSPVLIVVGVKHNIAEIQGERIVPVEDFAAAAAAVENLLLAAHALGLDAHWRTGDGAYDPLVKGYFGLDARDEIVGIVYVGYEDKERAVVRGRARSFSDKTEWRGWD